MNARHWQCIAMFLFWLFSVGTPAARAETPVNEAVPLHIQTELPKAIMQGQGTYRWFGLRIYDATLWTGPEGWNDQQKHKVALDLRYARNLVGRKIADASVQEMEKLHQGSASQRQQWLQQMTSLFPDVKEGTHITGIYVPNESARFYLDGKWLGEIRDAEFARAFFSIWLDPQTSAPDLRKKLLGHS
ncbi:chalcone isomerase family protein [Undibacterium sp. Ji67W]|uniref:chalcone isomerase family protein n=1 Tax=Undibacterium sp. Ji67W TaxID=3413042 RepID=UPI003BEFCB49